MTPTTHGLIASLAATAIATSSLAQMDPPVELEITHRFDSGPVVNESGERAVIFSHVVHVPKAPWLRLVLDQATLGGAPAGGEPTVLLVTSLLDGAVHALDHAGLQQWQYTSAYFNGDMLLVEIVADPGAEPSRVSGSRVLAGAESGVQEISICGLNDDRELSTDDRVARIWPNGCTAFLIDDVNHCLLTAGHCAGSGLTVIEFNVPISDDDGNANHPDPADQYNVDPDSLQTNHGQGVGDDWAYFGVFPNDQTGLTPFETQGVFFVRADTPPPVDGQMIRITGFGTTFPPVPDELNRSQKTHAGPYAVFSGTTVQYETDTTGGNSGSPVINDDTGEIIGIHTHGGCGVAAGVNSGTGINHADLQLALANPQGVCVPLAPANDDCDSASLVVAGDNPFSTVNGTTDGFAEPGACSFELGANLENDVWFRHVAPCAGILTLTLGQLDFDAQMAVYDGLDCPQGPDEAIACVQTAVEDSIALPVALGQTFLIRVGGSGGATGAGVLTLSCEAVPPCLADCADPPDGMVDVIDLLTLLGQWGQMGSCVLTGENDVVDGADLLAMLGAFGTKCE